MKNRIALFLFVSLIFLFSNVLISSDKETKIYSQCLKYYLNLFPLTGQLFIGKVYIDSLPYSFIHKNATKKLTNISRSLRQNFLNYSNSRYIVNDTIYSEYPYRLLDSSEIINFLINFSPDSNKLVENPKIEDRLILFSKIAFDSKFEKAALTIQEYWFGFCRIELFYLKKNKKKWIIVKRWTVALC